MHPKSKEVMLAYNPTFVVFIAVLFIVLTAFAIIGIVKKNRGRINKAIGAAVADRGCKVGYFPQFVSSKAIVCYIVTLIIVSALFLTRALPFQFIVFGFVSVFVFFHFSNRLTMDWRRYTPQQFAKKLFVTALLIRLVYVIFIYF